MLVAYRVAGLSALILDYAVKVARAQFRPTQSPNRVLAARDRPPGRLVDCPV
jgi:hypothetical protein